MDLPAALPIPSIFDTAAHSKRTSLRFLYQFAQDLARPINEGDAAIEYIPTQFATQYTRDHLRTGDGHSVDAIRYPSASDEPDGVCWVVFADQGDGFVGVVRLAPVDAGNRSARLAIGILDPARLGHGIGTEAILLALRWGFEELGLHRVSLTVVANSRAVAAYTRCGLVVEGRFRDSLWLGGRWHDDLSMAILEPQWTARQANAAGPVTDDT